MDGRDGGIGVAVGAWSGSMGMANIIRIMDIMEIMEIMDVVAGVACTGVEAVVGGDVGGAVVGLRP